MPVRQGSRQNDISILSTNTNDNLKAIQNQGLQTCVNNQRSRNTSKQFTKEPFNFYNIQTSDRVAHTENDDESKYIQTS